MSDQPQSVSSSEEYLGYQIRTRVVGPLKSNPSQAADHAFHYRATLAVFYKGDLVDGSREDLKTDFADEAAAEEGALRRGRELVGQYR